MLQAPSIFETPADLDREIAVVTVADHLGNIVTYPTVESVSYTHLTLPTNREV